jgi:hypothetical protein
MAFVTMISCIIIYIFNILKVVNDNIKKKAN